LRLRVVQRERAGESLEQLARTLDSNPRTIYRWLERFHYGGEAAPRNKPKSGRSPKLNAAQISWMGNQVRETNPS
jgi:transposase